MKKIYGILDKNLGFVEIFVGPNDASIIRGFADNINSKERNTLISQHPEDYALYRIASINDTDEMDNVVEDITVKTFADNKISLVVEAKELVKKELGVKPLNDKI